MRTLHRFCPFPPHHVFCVHVRACMCVCMYVLWCVACMHPCVSTNACIYIEEPMKTSGYWSPASPPLEIRSLCCSPLCTSLAGPWTSSESVFASFLTMGTLNFRHMLPCPVLGIWTQVLYTLSDLPSSLLYYISSIDIIRPCLLIPAANSCLLSTSTSSAGWRYNIQPQQQQHHFSSFLSFWFLRAWFGLGLFWWHWVWKPGPWTF